jgi:hypothetical protein
MFCHDTARNSDHKSRDCLILKKLGFKLEKRTGSDNTGGDAASCVTAPPAGDALKPASSPAPTLDATTGSETIPGTYAATAEPDSYDSGDDYDYEGRSISGLTYSGTRSGKPNTTSIAYINTSPSCHHTRNNAPTMEDGYDPPYMRGTDNFAPPMGGNHFAARSSCDPQGVKTIYLPKTVLALLQNPRAYKPDRKRCGNGTTLLVADTGATDHMLPDKLAFISYYPVVGLQVCMGNNLFALILGYGTAIISLNGKKILIRDCLHVPDLCNPLYSLRAHQRQHGCGFIGMFGLGFHVFFPTFTLEVDTVTNRHLAYALVGQLAGLPDLDYVQPKLPPKASASASSTVSIPPATIEPDDNESSDDAAKEEGMTYIPHWPKRPPSPSPPAIALNSFTPIKFTKSLNNMTAVELAQLHFKEAAPPDSYPLEERKRKTSDPLTCMDTKDIIELLHTPDSSPPPIRPCDTPNPSDTKSHWKAKELHCITGCCHFCNYQHLLSVSKDGTYINNGKFPTSIGAYTTIPKAPQGTAIDRTSTKYLDVVHLDIAFGNCMSVGGFKYALIFVDRATRYNWSFGLKSLHHDDIITAFLAFWSEAGSLAKQFHCDCDEKLFGSHVRLFLHLERSSIIASPAGQHSANGLVESDWKIMVHMSRAYLTEKQMPPHMLVLCNKTFSQYDEYDPGQV